MALSIMTFSTMTHCTKGLFVALSKNDTQYKRYSAQNTLSINDPQHKNLFATLSIMTLSIMTLGIVTPSIMTLRIIPLRINDTQHK